jgi:DNA modification methylase
VKNNKIKDLFTIHNSDARNISEFITEEIVDVTISSPPYFDLKDYGYKGQIGFGQDYTKYLEDLKTVFTGVYNCTKPTGSMWVIIDAFRRNDEVIPLPFDFSNKMKEIGWLLQEIIIWEKDKTVPWAHQGQMRNIFEYILVFSKTKQYKFNIDRVRDFETLKKWWVKYPERYNPKGKTPTGIWQFEIPTQGSWGKEYKSHFCPLPEKLIERIIKITTDEGDVVLDPFAGSGTVPSISKFMKRKYVGFELNSNYIDMFQNYVAEVGEKRQSQYEKEHEHTLKQSDFENLILELRILKFAKVLFQNLQKNGIDYIINILVEKDQRNTSQKHAIAKAKYTLLLKEGHTCESLIDYIQLEIKRTPLSKYGLESEFEVLNSVLSFYKKVENKIVFNYSQVSTHCYKERIDLKNQIIKYPQTFKYLILSEIRVALNEKNYE